MIGILYARTITALLTGCVPAEAHPGTLPAGVDLQYTLTRVRSPFSMVEVSLSLHADADGTTDLALMDWGSDASPADAIRRLTVVDHAGRLLPATHPSGQSWQVTSPPDEPLTVRYWLVSAQYDVEPRSSSYYRPVVNEERMHFVGYNTLIQPLERDGVQTIDLRWRGFGDWTVASSWGADPSGFRVRSTLHDFYRSLFVAGPFRLLERPTAAGPVTTAVLGRDWAFSDENLADVTAKILDTERRFWGDRDDPYFLVSLLPVGPKSTPADYVLAGTSLEHSFALFFQPAGLGLIPSVLHVIAHETFHEWNGIRIKPERPEALANWFKEGFTDFYARRILFRAGLEPLDAYVADLDDKLRAFSTSPARNEPNARVVDPTAHTAGLAKLPYRRGEIAALLVDHELRTASRGTRSLDDLMREILAAATAGEPITTDTLLARMTAATSPAFGAMLRGLVVDGETPVLPADLLAPCLVLEPAADGVPRFVVGDPSGCAGVL